MTPITQTVGALIACRGLTVRLGAGDAAVEALRSVDLDVDARRTIALVGRSGCGKTTLLHALGGLVTPFAGRIEWSDATLRPAELTAGRRGRAVAYVFQAAALLPYFTAHENVAFAARLAAAAEGSWPTPPDLLEMVGLAAKRASLPDELSGGEAQRVAIARALAQRPALLLCDEPTGHLDSSTGRRVLDLIDALRSELGFGLVVATHDAEVASRYDRAVRLADGRVVAEEETA